MQRHLLASLVRPPARHPQVTGFRLPCIGPPCIDGDPSATAALQSPILFAPRPRSRPGIPAQLCRFGGRHRFHQASSPPVQAHHFAATFPVSPSPAFIHARRTSYLKCFCPFPGVNRPGFVPRRSGSRLCHSQIKQTAKEAATAPEASGSGRCRCGATNCIAKLPADASAITRFMYSSPTSVYRSFHCAPCGST